MASRDLSLVLLVACRLGPASAWGRKAPPGGESPSLVTPAGYLKQWPPGPSPTSAPDWAAPGRIRSSRWDGGPIETAKATLSGWPGFNPPIPNYLYSLLVLNPGS